MKRLRAIRRWAGLAVAVACWWLAVGATALAAGHTNINNEEITKSAGASKYVASYGVVLLGIGLGLLVVCNSARRRDREKPEKYGE